MCENEDLRGEKCEVLDACVSYEEEDTCGSYQEEDTRP